MATRQRISYFLFFISLAMNGLLAFFLVSRYTQIQGIPLLSDISQLWWFVNRPARSEPLQLILARGGILSLVTLTASFSLIRAFRQSSSQEIFYVQLFLLCLSFYSLRLGAYFVSLHRLPFSYNVLLTRIVLFFRFSSYLFLILSGLSVFDSRFQKNDPFFLSAVIISLSLAFTIPMGDRFIQNTLSYLPVNERGLFSLFLITSLIIPLNFLWFFYRRKTLNYFVMTLAVVLLLLGESMVYYTSPWGFPVGLALLLIGSILFSHRIYRLYLWR